LIFHDTDREWEAFGQGDPYFGVLSHDKYRKGNLDQDNREDFFHTGELFIAHVLGEIRKHLDSSFTPDKVLDFGCGVGRLTIPLARVAGRVTGIDVSDSMLVEARKNCAAFSVDNADFVPADDDLSRLTGPYDLIVSFIVFQHIPPRRGAKVFRNLLAHLHPGGIGVLHFTYAKNGRGRKLAAFLKNYFPLSKYLINLGMRRKISTPQMQMNSYDLNKVFHLLQQSGVSEFHAEYSDHGGELGLILYFKKP
jgi:2-polyprenyl-3-methyl-5-hydroxy-6-metoxy-1,4-benzoquinol methylase